MHTEEQATNRLERHEVSQADKEYGEAVAAALAPLGGRKLRLDMPDGSAYDFPVEIIAKDRASTYKAEFDNDLIKALTEDTVPLFLEDNYNIIDWARNNMSYGELAQYKVKSRLSNPPDVGTVWDTAPGDKFSIV